MAKKNSNGTPVYLTKRRLVSAARLGVKRAAAETMEVAGYNVVAKGGWVVKQFADGSTERISRIPVAKSAVKKGPIVLD
ncbi:MAG: hypothetical protein KIT80_10775 [Chitinophagaceae bacterium]|nr:hypothetical protein [Chitinophagaceae bacterium]MCW5927386.1 hypothetical protein [Chitinophagaceae bacterium]